MNIYLLSQYENSGYDTYDSCVVYAESEDAARLILPSERAKFAEFGRGTWARSPEGVEVQYLGATGNVADPGVILASFNAG
jgi:hypothetical protein